MTVSRVPGAQSSRPEESWWASPRAEFASQVERIVFAATTGHDGSGPPAITEVHMAAVTEPLTIVRETPASQLKVPLMPDVGGTLGVQDVTSTPESTALPLLGTASQSAWMRPAVTGTAGMDRT